MKWFRLSSIRARMTAIFGTGAALLMIIFTALLSWNSWREAENSARSSLDSAAASLRVPIKQGASLEEIKKLLSQHNAKVPRGTWANEVEGWLKSRGGAVKWQTGHYFLSHPNGDDDQFPEGIPPNGGYIDGAGMQPGGPNDRGGPGGGDGRPGDGWGFLFGRPHGIPPWMQFNLPPQDDPSNWRSVELKRGSDTLILGVPWFVNARGLRSQTLSLLVLCLMASSAAAVGAWFLVGKVLSPIEWLAAQAGDLAQSESFEGRLSVTSSDFELQHLTATLNDMLQVLSETARSKERFHTAASHELRTPLQALSGHLQVALSRFRSPEEYRLALEEAASQTERLNSLTSDLLMLNQLQMATSRPPHEPVDATEVLAHCIDRSVPMLEARAVTIVEELDPCEVETAPSHLEMLIRNLVENAVKYVRDGGRIIVGLHLENLNIWNETSALLQDDDLSRLFEPFFRPDASRHSSTGGNGLGLSICRAICEANGWEINLGAEEREGRPGVFARVQFSPGIIDLGLD